MTSSRKLSLLAAALAVLTGLAVYLWLYGRPATPATNPLKKGDIEKISRLTIKNAAGESTLEKKDGVWQITEPVQDVVDPMVAADLVASLQSFTLGSIVSENSAKYGQFALDAGSAAHVRVYKEGQPKPVLDGYIGKNTSGYENCYFRFEASTPVYVANNLPEYQFRRDPKGFRLMKLFTLPPSGLTGVKFVQDKSTVELVHSSDTWTRAGGAKPLPAALVSQIVPKIEALTVADFGTGKETDDALGFDKPFLTVNLAMASGPQTLVIGKKSIATPTLRYAQVEGRPSVLLVPENTISDVAALIKALP